MTFRTLAWKQITTASKNLVLLLESVEAPEMPIGVLTYTILLYLRLRVTQIR